MRLKLHVTNKNIDYANVSMFGTVVATYNRGRDTMEVSLPRVWKYYSDGGTNIDNFVFAFSKDISHEYLHREVWKEIEAQKLNLGQLPLTSQEWAVKKLNGEYIDEFTLVPNIYQDLKNTNLVDRFNISHEKELRYIKLIRTMYFITLCFWVFIVILMTARMFFR